MECQSMRNEPMALCVTVQQIVLAMKMESVHVQEKKDIACADQTVIVANNHFLFILFSDKLI